MKIVVFNSQYLESAYHLSIRTGLDVVQGDWIPEAKSAYIIFGAEYVMDVLVKARNEYELTYIIMNNINPERIPEQYTELIKDSVLICQNINWPQIFNDLGFEAEYGIFESFKPPKDLLKTHDYIMWSGAEVKTPKCTKIRYLHRDKEYTVEDMDKHLGIAKVYVNTRKDDWLSIHKAIACGLQIISCRQDKEMEEIYKPYALFVDKIDLETVVHNDIPEQDYKEFLETVGTYSLNKMLPVIKNAFIKTKGTTKEQRVTIAHGTDSDGKEVADIIPHKTEE